MSSYLHGYTGAEQQRLVEQAKLLENFVYEGIDFSQCKHIIEVGCGVAGQTEILLKRFPKIKVSGIDLSMSQIQKAKLRFVGNPRVNFAVIDAQNISNSYHDLFDGAFLCWVLEHMPNPTKVLQETYKCLKSGSVLYAIEVMNHNFYYEPKHPAIDKFWNAFNALQVKFKGHPNIGACLGNIMIDAGFENVKTWMATHLYDKSSRDKRLSILNYWHSLLNSASENLVKENMLSITDINDFNTAFEALKTNDDVVFYYAAVKVMGTKK